MHVIDIVLAALILLGLIRGFMRGLFVEVASLFALVAGVYGAIHFSNYIASYIEAKTNWADNTVSIAAFAITFIVIIILISLAGKAFTKLANFAALGILNKLLGGVFGGLKIALILSVVLIVFSKMNSTITFVNDEKIKDSMLYNPVRGLAPMLFPSLLKSEEPKD